jgi:hypothetical protein
MEETFFIVKQDFDASKFFLQASKLNPLLKNLFQKVLIHLHFVESEKYE